LLIAGHRATGDVFRLVVSALTKAGKSYDALTAEDLAPVDPTQGFMRLARAVDPTPPVSRQIMD
jgi:hypothetical protein